MPALLWRLLPRAAVVHLNFRAGSTFPFPVCTVLSSMDMTSRWPVQQGWRGQTLCFIQVEFTFTKGAEVRAWNYNYSPFNTVFKCQTWIFNDIVFFIRYDAIFKLETMNEDTFYLKKKCNINLDVRLHRYTI